MKRHEGQQKRSRLAAGNASPRSGKVTSAVFSVNHRSERSGLALASQNKSAHEMQAERGDLVHKSMMIKKKTNSWETGYGKKGNLSYAKMRAAVNLRHPRVNVDGEPREVPLCVDTGRLTGSTKKELHGLDELGIATSIYFKLLKALIGIFCLCSFVALPLYFLYASGKMSQ
jgi:hypothetical protein